MLSVSTLWPCNNTVMLLEEKVNVLEEGSQLLRFDTIACASQECFQLKLTKTTMDNGLY
jgi:hypothetical protein